MLSNYFKTAIRNFFRYKGYSLINVTGLAIGMACCLLILMFVNDELSYDKYNDNADRIYRLVYNVKFGGKDMNLAVCPPAASEAFVREFPEVIDAVRFNRHNGTYIVKYKDKVFKESDFVFSDSSLFRIFTIPLLEGNLQTALKDPNSIVLSKRAAKKYFGRENPIGKLLNLDNEEDYKVTGIFDKIPNNSHFRFDFIASLNSLRDVDLTNWSNENYNTYLLLSKSVDPEALEAKFPLIIKKYFAPFIARIMGKSYDDLEANGNLTAGYSLQPLLDIHLHSDLTAELGANSDVKYIYIFIAIAFFILIIAAINFMNLSTARSAGRAREVGIRKVMGSIRGQLISQFLTESMVMSFISMLIAFVLMIMVIPFFNNLSGKELTLTDNFNPVMALSMLSITLLAGLLAGFYPAFFISAFQPVNVLKGQLKSGIRSKFLRRILVVFQFTASIILVIGTMVVLNQLNYIQNKKLGFNKDRILILENTYLLGSQAKAFKETMLRDPNIEKATLSQFLPVPSTRRSDAVIPEGEASNKNTTSVQKWIVDYDYLETLGMKIVDGRNFSREYSTDNSGVIINQKMAKVFGWENPVGKRIGRFVSDQGDIEMSTVIGVVEDFHFESLRDRIGALVLHLGESNGRISFRIKGHDIPAALDTIRKGWKSFLPGQPFEYSFMDDRFDTFYEGERRIGKILSTFASLAIFIGCLGLLGMAAFVSEQRTKEIGIRKVLGASVPNIIKLLSKEFALLVGAANLIAWPTAYFIMKDWLQDYAYKAPLDLWIFLLSGFLSLGIALFTTGYQAVKAAYAEPVKSIRYE